MTLIHSTITPIQDEVDAVPSLFNTRLEEINENFAALEEGSSNVFLAHQISSQGIANTAYNVFQWDNIKRNDGSLVPGSSGNLVIVPAGYSSVRVSAAAGLDGLSSVAGVFAVGALINGSPNSNYQSLNGFSRSGIIGSVASAGSFISSWIDVSAGDTIGSYIFNSGYSTTTDTNACWLQIEFKK